jgi:hypothetical protein
LKDDFRAALLHVPDDVKTELRDAFEKCRIQRITNHNLDFIFLFAKSRAGLELELLPAAKALAPAGMYGSLGQRRVQASPPTSREMWFAKAGWMLAWST